MRPDSVTMALATAVCLERGTAPGEARQLEGAGHEQECQTLWPTLCHTSAQGASPGSRSPPAEEAAFLGTQPPHGQSWHLLGAAVSGARGLQEVS